MSAVLAERSVAEQGRHFRSLNGRLSSLVGSNPTSSADFVRCAIHSRVSKDYDPPEERVRRHDGKLRIAQKEGRG